jgi:hypothetical protein
MLVEVAPKPLGIEAQLLGMPDELLVVERRLLVEETVVQLPEFALDPCRFGRLGRVLGVRVLFAQREVAEHHPQAIAQAPPELLDDRVGHAAERALEVAIFDQRNRRVGRAEGLVALADR